MLFSSLIIVHVILTTAGYVGLIAANAWLLLLCRDRHAGTMLAGVHAWRRIARIFGPLLGIGMLAGFALASTMGMPLTARWLLGTYAAIVLALTCQMAIMIPLQRRAETVVTQGGVLPTRPIVAVLSALTIAYVVIASLMLLRPA